MPKALAAGRAGNRSFRYYNAHSIYCENWNGHYRVRLVSNKTSAACIGATMNDAAVNAEPSGTALPVALTPPPEPGASAGGAKKSAHSPAAASPAQSAPDGIRFDFNFGARVVLPPRTDGKWRVCLRDLDTGNILFQSENRGTFVSSSKRFLSGSSWRFGTSARTAP